MTKLLNKINHYILYDPELLKQLKDREGKLIRQTMTAAGHTIMFTVGLIFIVPVGVLDQYLHIIHLGKTLSLALFITSVLLQTWLTYCIAKEHKIFDNLKKFDKDKKRIEERKSSVICLEGSSSDKSNNKQHEKPSK